MPPMTIDIASERLVFAGVLPDFEIANTAAEF